MRIFFGSLLILTFIIAIAPALAIERTDQTNAKIEKLRDVGISTAKRGCSNAGRVTNKPVTNRHNPRITDKMQRTVCSGLDIRYYVAYVHTPPKKMLDSIEITGASLKLPYGLKLGTPKSEIRRALEIPDSSGPNSVTYYAPEGEASGNDGVTFIFEQGRLIKFNVGFHYD